MQGQTHKITILLRGIFKPGKIIIFDEPLSGLDATTRQKVIKLINEYCINKTVIVITHDKELLQHMDRMIYFDKGKIIQDEILKNK